MTDQTILLIADETIPDEVLDKCKPFTGVSIYTLYNCTDILPTIKHITDVKVLKKHEVHNIVDKLYGDDTDGEILITDVNTNGLPQQIIDLLNQSVCTLSPCLFTRKSDVITISAVSDYVTITASIPFVQHRHLPFGAGESIRNQPWIDTVTSDSYAKNVFYPSHNKITKKSLVQLRHVKRDDSGIIIAKSAPSKVYTIELI